MSIEVRNLVGMRETIGLFLAVGVMVSCSTFKSNRDPASDQNENVEKIDVLEKEIKIGLIPLEKRNQALVNAQIIDVSQVNIGQVDIIKGPDQRGEPNRFEFGDEIVCKFKKPGEKMGGASPKFKCELVAIRRKEVSSSGELTVKNLSVRGGDSVKVKYTLPERENKEVHAEAAATRLFWAMGFYADSVFPVSVTCYGCPIDPRKAVSEENPVAPGGLKIALALVERKHPGVTLDYQDDEMKQGWSWEELAQNTKNAAAVKDALLLLTAFIGHGDAKPPQQRLVCPNDKIQLNQASEYLSCSKPKMFVQDMGATFGGGGNFTTGSAKMDLEHWMNKDDDSVWKDAGKCQARLNTSMSAKGSIENPEVSEVGRRYLAARLCALSDKQIHDIFYVARVDQLKDEEARSISKWVALFKEKRRDIVDNQCSTGPQVSSHFGRFECERVFKKAHPELDASKIF